MDFVAIDLETANADLSSICQLGIAAYTEGRLVQEWTTYVNPEDYFSSVNVAIHGIDESMVKDAPKFYELADDVYRYMDNRVVVSHTHFDRVAILQTCQKYELRSPQATWLDSAKVARRTWSEFAWSGYGLANVCNSLGYRYKCHDALEDAKAAAVVLLAAVERTGIDIDGWLQRIEQPIDLRTAQPIRYEGNPDGPLYGERIVFTGTMDIPRREVANMAAKMGCSVQIDVNRDTTILVVGDQDIRKLAGHLKSSKHRAAEQLIAQGGVIRIIGARDFAELFKVAGYHSEEWPPVGIPNPSLPAPTGGTSTLQNPMSKERLHQRMVELLSQDRKREYLTLCKANLPLADKVADSIVPQYYPNLADPYGGFWATVKEAASAGNDEQEIRALDAAIQAGIAIATWYERLAKLWSKRGDRDRARQVCSKWFDSGLWKVAHNAATSLRLLDRMEKLSEPSERD